MMTRLRICIGHEDQLDPAACNNVRPSSKLNLSCSALLISSSISAVGSAGSSIPSVQSCSAGTGLLRKCSKSCSWVCIAIDDVDSCFLRIHICLVSNHRLSAQFGFLYQYIKRNWSHLCQRCCMQRKNCCWHHYLLNCYMCSSCSVINPSAF